MMASMDHIAWIWLGIAHSIARIELDSKLCRGRGAGMSFCTIGRT